MLEKNLDELHYEILQSIINSKMENARIKDYMIFGMSIQRMLDLGYSKEDLAKICLIDEKELLKNNNE